jgi:predicted nucleic acid-binding Zn ribbon protein
MYCPKCGKENPDDGRTCSACNYELLAVSAEGQKVQVKTSRLAIASFVLALVSVFIFYFIFYLARTTRGRSENILILAVYFITSWAAIIFGVISLIRIGLSAGRLAATGFAVIGAVLPFSVYGLLMFIAYLRPVRMTAYRMTCGVNLSRIGKAMLIYANDYKDELPRAGGRGTIWHPKINNWQADNRISAYGLQPDATGGQASISASFYLLIKYAEIVPKSFVCTNDKGTTEFKPTEYGVGDKNLIDLWDFGPEPWKHCSYAYHIPYGSYALTTSSEPGMAVAADRNPWLATGKLKARNFSLFNPDGDIKQQKAGNSLVHQEDGQQVLFMDTHVYFEKRAFCGINDDNIYTFWDGSDIRRGAPPNLGSQPMDRRDSLLVHDPP